MKCRIVCFTKISEYKLISISYFAPLMNWQTKASLLSLLSRIPGGRSLHYLTQRYLSRSLPVSDQAFREFRIENAGFHLHNLQTYFPKQALESAVLFEFGAGWELGIPLIFAGLGIGQQRVYDLHRHARLSLLQASWKQILAHRQAIEQQTGRKFSTSRIEHSGPKSWRMLSQEMGIQYQAPGDARATGLSDSSVDFCHNSSTLEHIASEDIHSILEEMYRILKPGGILSCVIDLQDHYSYADPQISPYHFLQYSRSAWEQFNPAFHFQNRLRHPDYRHLFEQAGFEVVHETLTGPDAELKNSLQHTAIHSEFGNQYTLDELGIRTVECVLRK